MKKSKTHPTKNGLNQPDLARHKIHTQKREEHEKQIYQSSFFCLIRKKKKENKIIRGEISVLCHFFRGGCFKK